MSQLPTGFSDRYWSAWHTQLNRTVAETLEGGEAWIGSWSSVGLYEKCVLFFRTFGCSHLIFRDNKVADYQSVSIHLTTHRLIIIPDSLPAGPSGSASSRSRIPAGLQLHLRYVRQTEFYTGFMRSSPKITLSINRTPTDESLPPIEQATNWACGVCGYVNTVSGPNGTLGSKCGLCGVGYATAISISSPASRTSTPAPTLGPVVGPTDVGGNASKAERAPLPASRLPKEIACPACTFLNHPSLTTCEICSTALPKKQQAVSSTAAPQGEPDQNGIAGTGQKTPGGANGEEKAEIVRLSFRKGGDKEAYRRLKNVLSDKAWERVGPLI